MRRGCLRVKTSRTIATRWGVQRRPDRRSNPYFINLAHCVGLRQAQPVRPETAAECWPERFLGTDGFAVRSELG
jgi:hypothetical protein